MGSMKSSDRPLAFFSSIGPVQFFSLWRLVRLFSAGYLSLGRRRWGRAPEGSVGGAHFVTKHGAG